MTYSTYNIKYSIYIQYIKGHIKIGIKYVFMKVYYIKFLVEYVIFLVILPIHEKRYISQKQQPKTQSRIFQKHQKNDEFDI